MGRLRGGDSPPAEGSVASEGLGDQSERRDENRNDGVSIKMELDEEDLLKRIQNCMSSFLCSFLLLSLFPIYSLSNWLCPWFFQLLIKGIYR